MTPSAKRPRANARPPDAFLDEAVRLLAASWNDLPRHDTTLALAGTLARAGWHLPDALRLVEAVAAAAGDDEPENRRAAVEDTYRRRVGGKSYTGRSKLRELLGGDAALARLEEALGLNAPPTLDSLAANKRLPLDFLGRLGVHDLPGGVGIPYRDGAGKEVAVKKRFALGEKSWGAGSWPQGTPTEVYGADQLNRAADAGYQILVEGESDCWALWYHDFPALGLPGANAAGKLEIGHVGSAKVVYIAQEPGDAGKGFVLGAANRLAEVGYAGDVRAVRLPGATDPGDLHVQDPNAFKECFQQALDQAGPIRPRPAKPSSRRRLIRPVTPYQPFPVEALPAPLAEFVRQGAAALGCDPAFVALPVLAVAASAVGNARVLQLKRTWSEPCVVWSVIVGDSGTLKSPAYDLATLPLFKIQRRLLAEYRAAVLAHNAAVLEHKAAKRGGDDAPEPPEEPTSRRVVVNDITLEKLVEVLEDNPRGVLGARDELAGWLTSFCRYKGKGGGSDLPPWLSMFRAGPVLIDRKTAERRTSYVPRAAVSVTGGIQPDTLARCLGPEFLDAGLGARLLMAMPTERKKKWSEAEVDPDVERAYSDVLEKLMALELDRGNDGEMEPHTLRLSPEAKVLWVAFYDDWACEQAAVEGELAAAYSKLEAYAARFALLHHVVTHAGLEVDDLRPVGPRSVEAGVALCRWFAAEARRVYAILAETAEQRDVRRLSEFIQARGGSATVKELQRSSGSKYPGAGDAEDALNRLVEAGLAVWRARPAGARGGRPTRDCVLLPHPTLDETDETPLRPASPAQPGADETSDETSTEAEKLNVSEGFVGFVKGRVRESGEERFRLAVEGVSSEAEGFVGRGEQADTLGGWEEVPDQEEAA